MQEHRLEFETNASRVDPSPSLRWLRGRCELSRPYEYELELEVLEDGGLSVEALEDLLRAPCLVRFGQSAGSSEIHGVLRSIRMVTTSAPTPIVYRATLVPRVWIASQVRRSRIFQEKSVPQIVQAVLEELGFRADTHFEWRLTTAYTELEYTVQYQESDLDFVHRLIEHLGIFYFFEQTPDGERIVFADDNRAFFPLIGSESLDYTPGDEVGLTGVLELERELTPKPAVVLLRDYNWRTPTLQLHSEAPADERTGRGLSALYGDHFKDAAEGDALARVRAQELLATRELYFGRCRLPLLAPGHAFDLIGHPCVDLDQAYVVTAVEETADGRGVEQSGGVGYDKRFVAIPRSVAFRPARCTPKPRIAGIMHARVDGEVPGTAAPIDEYGRYRILFPFDLVGRPGGRASRWVRLAQPASGPGFGIHFPLHIGAEVAIAHIDGDPDRPIILSSPPNTDTISPVTMQNSTQSQIVTQGGVRLTWDDDVRV